MWTLLPKQPDGASTSSGHISREGRCSIHGCAVTKMLLNKYRSVQELRSTSMIFKISLKVWFVLVEV